MLVGMPEPIALARNSPAPEPSGDSAQNRAQLQLRELVLSGAFAPGSRITEVAMSERLGVSRTPVRAALVRLEKEGLLEALPSGGFAVRSFSEREVSEAIELRGLTEGLSARLAAERGASSAMLSKARQLLEGIDDLLRQHALDDEAFAQYVEYNGRFHALLGELSESAFLRRELERVASQPFASPSAFVVVQANSPKARDMLIVAQDQHWQVLDAIERREGARAEALMREHSRLAQRNLRAAVQGGGPMMDQLPGVQLIRRR
jgi:GntR family transcriptional regulator, vanillate catabolism transcriptional regulator